MRASFRWARRDVLAVLVLILGVSIFHARGLGPGQTFLPVDLTYRNLPWMSESAISAQNWLISDPFYQFYPFLDRTVKSIQGAGWLLWNPYIFAGHPSFADPLFQTFYPVLTGLGLLFGAARGFAIGLWLQVVLAAVLMYGFLRTVGCLRYAAAGGALTYSLSGYMVTWFETPFWLSTLSLLPGILWAFELAIAAANCAMLL